MRISSFQKTLCVAFVAFVATIPSTAFAGGAASGGATEWTQVFNKLELIPINANDSITAYSTAASQVKEVIKDPIIGGLVNAAIKASTEYSVSWINGQLNGKRPLIQDPVSYITNKTLNQARISINSLPYNSLYGDQAFNALVNNSKQVSVQTRIRQAAQSKIPSIVQKNMCTDSMLTKLAKERVADANNTYDQETMLVEKEYLYGYACAGDPNSDEGLATRLMDLYKQRPELGGGDAWLALTSGDNTFAKTNKIIDINKDETEKVTGLALKELYGGLNAISETKCVDEQINELRGETYCAQEEVITPGKSVQTALDTAGNAALNRLISTTPDGFGTLITGLATQLLVRGINQGLNNLITQTQSNSGNTARTNTSYTLSTTQPLRQDLINDPDKKNELIDTFSKQTDFTFETLDELASIDKLYKEEVANYKTKILGVKAACDKTTSAYPQANNQGEVKNAYAYYNDRMALITGAENDIQKDTEMIPLARKLTQDVLDGANKSNSSREISTLFSEYLRAYERAKYPTQTTSAKRKQGYEKNKVLAQSDDTSPNSGVKNYDFHISKCTNWYNYYWDLEHPVFPVYYGGEQ